MIFDHPEYLTFDHSTHENASVFFQQQKSYRVLTGPSSDPNRMVCKPGSNQKIGCHVVAYQNLHRCNVATHTTTLKSFKTLNVELKGEVFLFGSKKGSKPKRFHITFKAPPESQVLTACQTTSLNSDAERLNPSWMETGMFTRRQKRYLRAAVRDHKGEAGGVKNTSG